jgi:hypothetical protein
MNAQNNLWSYFQEKRKNLTPNTQLFTLKRS